MKKIFTLIFLIVSSALVTRAQSVYQPYSYQFYQKLNADVYSTKTRVHSALKPFLVDDSLLRRSYDSLMNYGSDGDHSAGYRKLFTEHQIDVKNDKSTFYADLLPDLVVGRDFRQFKRTTRITSVGLQVGGTFGDKVSYNVSGFLNRALFPEYLTTYINQVGIVPGQAYDRSPNGDVKDWSYITANLSYTPVKYLNISAGRDRTFIGDGYRSLLLSDYASPATYFRLTGTLGNVRYMAMWQNFSDRMNPELNNYTHDRRKWGIFHFLDWNVSNRLSLGFFDAIVWPNEDDAGHKRGFDFAYINPIIFLRPVEASSGSPDNAVIGFTGKYKLSDHVTAYGQFMLDEFEADNFFSGEGSSRNKFGWQLGVRGANLFSIQGLNYLLETNTITPYTFSERFTAVNYSANSEPLAHPWGANFREVVGLLNYSYKRFDFSGEFDFGRYGMDLNGLNYGKDLFDDYREPARTTGNWTGQGLTTNMYLLEGKVAYLLNPKYNLRIELGGLIRDDVNSEFKSRTGMITIGLRSSFRSFYNDLAGFKSRNSGMIVN
ncbi:gliding motility protein RemB [Mucilaginibacter sp. JRF]|uniref:gliding motility protein RemB n=1 Tax=Mucilaginibacter sp. JRF TaxID=2780088 RepID=UPI00187FD253|nr:gliding motility protein RemB [Mucilaginibacter sp. JRF]MBE9585402.1 gliding motility protein RemB [Mucilaginibacter sp. JRF]